MRASYRMARCVDGSELRHLWLDRGVEYLGIFEAELEHRGTSREDANVPAGQFTVLERLGSRFSAPFGESSTVIIVTNLAKLT